jgi:ABC-type branched-subunit amino acid transport system ATPase component
LYSSVQISGYRGLGTFRIDGLGRINLLVGGNNSGKTSILECIELLRSAGTPSVLMTILGRRGEWATSSDEERQSYLDVTHLFANRDLDGTVVIEGDRADCPRSILGWNNRVSIEVAYLHNDQLELEEELSLEQDGHVALRINWSDPPSDLNIRLSSEGFLPWSSARRLSRFREASNQSVQFIRTDGIQATDVIRLFDDVVLTEREQHVTEALRIIDQSIERIASVGTERRPLLREAPGGVFLKLRGVPYRVPIGSLGDGMWRMLGVALALANAKGGILLVDEIDTGLHYSVMEDMWRMVSERATALDVQVFATTHSRDCYESLAAVVAPGSISTAVTIQRIDPSRGRAIGFSNDDIVAAAERGIEVR